MFLIFYKVNIILIKYRHKDKILKIHYATGILDDTGEKYLNGENLLLGILSHFLFIGFYLPHKSQHHPLKN